VDGVAWGDHTCISQQECIPAGKALNVSRAMAWMGTRSIAAGLWGRSDYELMLEESASLRDFVDVRFTPAEGSTRKNVTIIDTANTREMHLRAQCRLASRESLKDLSEDLQAFADDKTICIFAGALPEGELLSEITQIAADLSQAGCRIVIDSSQNALKRIVDSGDIWIVKPNLHELRQLLDDDVDDDAEDIVSKARRLNDRAQIVLVSRGEKGAIAVGKDFAVEAFSRTGGKKTLSTVGCGDYLLAGFTAGMAEAPDTNRIADIMVDAVKAATAKAWGLCDRMTRREAFGDIEVQTTKTG
jgi:fructose-1-phosphate kinase PfkB-like protein